MGSQREDEAVLSKGRMKIDYLNQYQLPGVEAGIPGNHVRLFPGKAYQEENEKERVGRGTNREMGEKQAGTFLPAKLTMAK